MNISELIEILQRYPQDSVVHVSEDGKTMTEAFGVLQNMKDDTVIIVGPFVTNETSQA